MPWKRRKISGVSGPPGLAVDDDEVQKSKTVSVVLPADLVMHLEKEAAVHDTSVSKLVRDLIKKDKVQNAIEVEKRIEVRAEEKQKKEGPSVDKGQALADAFSASLTWRGMGVNPLNPDDVKSLNAMKVRGHRRWEEGGSSS